MELKKTVEVINHVWVDDLNDFLYYHFKRKFSFPEEDIHYPKEHYVSPEISKFDFWIVESFIKGEDNEEINISSLLNYLCKDELLDKGYYLISRKVYKGIYET